MDQSGYAGLRKRQLDDGRETGEHTFGSNICSTRPQERSREGEAVDRTAVGSRVGFADRATRILPAVPLHRGPVRFRTLVFRYLAVAFVLLAAVVVVNPRHPDAAAPGATPWDYQHEQVDVEGRGALNAYARVTVSATAWLAKASIERQRDVFRLNLFDFLVGSGSAEAVGGFRAANGPGLEAATKAAILGLVLYGVLLRPARRSWAVAVLLLLVATVAITRPYGTVEAAARPGVQIPNAMLGVVDRVAPGAGSAAHPLLDLVRRPPAVPDADGDAGARVGASWQEGGRAGRPAQERLGGQRLGPGTSRARARLHRHLRARVRAAVRRRARDAGHGRRLRPDDAVRAVPRRAVRAAVRGGRPPAAGRTDPVLAAAAVGGGRGAGARVGAVVRGHADRGRGARRRRVRRRAAGRLDAARSGRLADGTAGRPPLARRPVGAVAHSWELIA